MRGRAAAAARVGAAPTPANDVVFSRVASEAFEAGRRAELLGDMIGRKLTSANTALLEHPTGLEFDWRNADLGGGFVLAKGRLSGLQAQRDAVCLKDGDDDFSLFLSLGAPTPFEQNDRREVLSPGDGLLVAHGSPVHSWWRDGRFAIVRLPRTALAGVARPDALAGAKLEGDAFAMRLLRAYLAEVWRELDADRALPTMALRHLSELVGGAVAGAAPAAEGALGAARVALMREVMARRFAEPALGMGEVAAAAGVSRRAGYLAFEAAGLNFSDELAWLRLDRALERLRGEAGAGAGERILDVALAVGFSDLSHFNRRFRARFGFTPSEARGR